MADDDEEEQDYDGTIDENAFLCDIFRRYSGPGEFLARPERIVARSIKLRSWKAGLWLNYETDIDGCVVELNNLTGVALPIRHITICPYGEASLREVKGVLRKHVRLANYSSEALVNFNHSVGIQLFYEYGWECWLGLIPDESVRSFNLSRDIIRHLAFQAFENVRKHFQISIARIANEGVAIKTAMKNDLHDLRKTFVLPDDVPAVLGALQLALTDISVRGFKPIIFSFRFGEKMRTGLSLHMFRQDCISKVTVHAALDISSRVPGVDLMWSMSGIQEVVGHRGTLGTCLSLSDCANFQSNLDHRAIDVKAELRRVCTVPSKMNFIQLYADTPHLRPKTRFHPISGLIAAGMCFPPNMCAAFSRDADKYISILEHNFGLLRRSSCRLEIVTEPPEVSDTIQAESCINMSEMDRLIEGNAVLVPIPSETLECIREVGLWLTKELKDMVSHYKKTGNVSASWRSFQFELACEKLLWGRPLCDQSNRYSVNLGPGLLQASRSLTDQRGFLALGEPTCCMESETSIPPYMVWTSSKIIGQSIARACGVHDHVYAGYPVIGRLLVLALLKDLYETGKVGVYFRFEEFLMGLKAEDSRFERVGAITHTSLVELLCMKRRIKLPMVFGQLCQLVTQHRLPLSEVVAAGIIELELTHFPAVETYDTHGHAVLKWNFRMNFWTIVCAVSSQPDNPSSPEVLSQLARGELERRRIIFPSRLKKLPVVWPWVVPCLRKLGQERLSEKALVTTIAFVSALAFQMQGWFVEFESFAALFKDLQVSQSRLKILEIQSKLLLAHFQYQGLKIFRLHERIPHRIQIGKADDKKRVVDDEEIEETVPVESHVNLIPENDELVETNQRIELRAPACLAVGVVKPGWSGKELEILENVTSEQRCNKTSRELYEDFRIQCMEENVPYRTWTAFRLKLLRLGVKK